MMVHPLLQKMFTLLLLFFSPLVVGGSPSAAGMPPTSMPSMLTTASTNNLQLNWSSKRNGNWEVSMCSPSNQPSISVAPTIQPSIELPVSFATPAPSPQLTASARGDHGIMTCNTADPFYNLNEEAGGLLQGNQLTGHPPLCSAPITQPSTSPTPDPSVFTGQKASSTIYNYKGLLGQPAMNMSPLNKDSHAPFGPWEDQTISSATYIQPTATPATLFARPRFMSPSSAVSHPAVSLKSTERNAWSSIIRGRTSSNLVPVHPSLMSQAQSSCFVPTFTWSKFKEQKQSVSHHKPPLNNKLIDHVAPMQQPTQSLTFTLGAGRENIELVDTNPGNNDQRKILPFLMYAAVPFIPSTLLSTLNDQYQTTKEQFNSFSATVPLNVPTDSPEYISMSSMYNDTMQSLFVLLLSKRLALYFLATLATTYAGWRAASSGVAALRDGGFGGPGEALDCLNSEVLKGESFAAMADESGKDLDSGEGLDKRDKKNDEDQLFANLVDDNPNQSSSSVGNGLAVALPLVLGASLTFSYLLTTLQSAGDQVSSPNSDAIQGLLSNTLPYLTPLPSAILCLLFVATEFRWILPPSSDDKASSDPAPFLCIANVLAFTYISGAYIAKINPTIHFDGITALDLWPLQNGVNFALAATVSRALSPFLLSSSVEYDEPEQFGSNKSIRTVALALTGLTLFDAISTFGTVANAAETVDAAATAAQTQSMSVMETVARSKLNSWQPGLLEIVLGHDNSKVTEALGLGDVVFPSILVAWGFAADKEVIAGDNDETGSSNGILSSYAAASVAGYVFGSFVTEIVGSFGLLGNRAGLPALVFLVPSMLAAVTVMAWSRDELGDVYGARSE